MRLHSQHYWLPSWYLQLIFKKNDPNLSWPSGTDSLNNPLGHIIILGTSMVPFNQGSQSALQTSTTLPLLLLIILLIYFSILQLRNLRHKKKKWYAAVHMLKKKKPPPPGENQNWVLGLYGLEGPFSLIKAKHYFHGKVIPAFLWCRTEWSLQLSLSFQENTWSYII